VLPATAVQLPQPQLAAPCCSVCSKGSLLGLLPTRSIPLRPAAGSVDVVLSYCHYCLNDTTLEESLPFFASKEVCPSRGGGGEGEVLGGVR
jgi:hypothetical protein